MLHPEAQERSDEHRTEKCPAFSQGWTHAFLDRIAIRPPTQRLASAPPGRLPLVGTILL